MFLRVTSTIVCAAFVPIADAAERAIAFRRATVETAGKAGKIEKATLVVRDATNVLVAGRCFSATHDAHASVRSMAQCMAMGQAAGTAAALAVAAERDPRDVEIDGLRDRLRRDGAILELEPTTRGAAP